MSTVQAAVVRSVVRAPGGEAPRAPSALLTGPPLLAAGAGDLQSLLFAARVGTRDSQARNQSVVVTQKSEKRVELHKQALAAEIAAEKAAEESSGWGKFMKVASTVATVAACVAAVASLVFSAGCSAPAVIALAGVLLSASSPVIAEKSEFLGKVALWGGAAASLLAGGISVYSAATQTAATAASSGGQIVASAGQTSSQAAETGSAALKAASTYIQASARVTEGSARMLQGYGAIKQGQANHAAESDTADSMSARAQMKKVQTDLDQTVDLLREVEASARRAMSSILGIGDSIRQSNVATIGRIGRTS